MVVDDDAGTVETQLLCRYFNILRWQMSIIFRLDRQYLLELNKFIDGQNHI